MDRMPRTLPDSRLSLEGPSPVAHAIVAPNAWQVFGLAGKPAKAGDGPTGLRFPASFYQRPVRALSRSFLLTAAGQFRIFTARLP